MMSGILASLFPAQAAPRQMEEYAWELRALPEGWAGLALLLLVAFVCVAVVWMYRREGRIGASLRLRLALAAVRCAVLATLAVIWLEPVRVKFIRRWIDSYTVVLVDASSSMDLADTYRDPQSQARVDRLVGERPELPRRVELAQEVLARSPSTVDEGRINLIAALSQRNRVSLHTFSDEPQLQAVVRAANEPTVTQPEVDRAQSGAVPASAAPVEFAAQGAVTNIGRAVRRSVEALGSAPIAGVVLLSDGVITEGESAAEVADYARSRKIPIYAVGIGDPTPPRNLRVTEVNSPENVFRQDPFAVSARFAAEGLDGESIQVELRERGEGGSDEGRVVATRQLAVGPGGVIDPVTFDLRQDRVGRYAYTVAAAAPGVEESVADDNQRQVSVNVIDARIKVLLVAGGPSWDYMFLTRLMQRDDTIDVSCWLQSADLAAVRDGDIVIDHLPATPEELFRYDVIILVDPNREEFDSAWCRLVDRFVTEYGGGLLLVAARSHTPAFLRAPDLGDLAALLPVTLDPEADVILNEVGHYQRTGSPVDVPDAALGHPVLRLADDRASNRLAWAGAGDVYWHYPVLRAKPVATVLLQHGDPRMQNTHGPHVLSAVQYVGAGRTGFVGFDGTWRWRRSDENLYNRFWVQYVRYLVEGRLLGGTKRGLITTQGDEFPLGEAVAVSARVLDARYEPLRQDHVIASYATDEQRRELLLVARPDQPGWYEGQFVPDRAGTVRISVSLPGAGPGEPLEATREIRVVRPNIEVIRPQMDRAALQLMAEESEGGRYFEVDEAGAIADLIPDRHEETVTRSRPTDMWDNGAVLALLAGLLTIEWAVRKWNRLL